MLEHNQLIMQAFVRRQIMGLLFSIEYEFLLLKNIVFLNTAAYAYVKQSHQIRK